MFPGFFHFRSPKSISIFLQSHGHPSETNPTFFGLDMNYGSD